MVVLDATIVNIALPSAQQALGFSTADRQWVITAYALAFGGLLLVGGRLGDIFGRKRTFVAGLAGFAIASAAGGAAPGFAELVAARAVQGAFGALLAPSALALLATTFTDARERGRALGIYTAIAGGGGAIGLLLGGVLTEYLSWRWCLYVNVVFAVVALAGALLFIASQPRSATARLDVPGSLLAVGGLAAIVFAFSEAARDGWSTRSVVRSALPCSTRSPPAPPPVTWPGTLRRTGELRPPTPSPPPPCTVTWSPSPCSSRCSSRVPWSLACSSRAASPSPGRSRRVNPLRLVSVLARFPSS
jgi:MFS family permease